jgi:GNAT superfamily N-acetyltransferase
MAVARCICGERLEGSDDELFGLFRSHVDQRHREYEISDDDLRVVLQGWSVGERWDGRRRAVEGPVAVRELGPDTVDDFLEFFDRRAFMDNPFWFGCYCTAPHHGEPKEQSGAENREEKLRLIRSGVAKGLLAYVDGRAVGWCNVAPRATLDGVMHRVLAGTNPDPSEPVGSIACFVIAAPWRGGGVGRSLLETAIDRLRDQGLAVAEAYPAKGVSSEAEVWRGPLDMYLRHGFERHGETETHLIVRKQL